MRYVNKILSNEVIRYLITGISTQILDFLFYTGLIFLNINYLIANLISAPIVNAYNYLTHKHFTFKKKAESKIEIFKYILNIFFLLIYSSLTLFIFKDFLRIDPLISKLLQIIIISFTNYFILKKFVFKK